MSKVYHMTFTGLYAGVPLCGCNKEKELEKGNEFLHAMYYPIKSEEHMKNVCPECWFIWNDTDTESDSSVDEVV